MDVKLDSDYNAGFCAEMLSAKVTQLFLMVFSSWLFLCIMN